MNKNTPGTKELSTKKSKRAPKHLEHINLLAAGLCTRQFFNGVVTH